MKQLLLLISLFFINCFYGQNPYLMSDEGYGKYGYIEKNATTYLKINSGNHNNLVQLFAKTWYNGNSYSYDTYPSSSLTGCPGANTIQNTTNIGFNTNVNTGTSAYTKCLAEYCGGGTTNTNDVPQREHLFFDISDNKATDLASYISPAPTGAKNVVLSIKIDFGSLSDRYLKRFWIENVGNMQETTHIPNDGFKIYYEAATGSETFTGNEDSAQLWGDYNSNSTTNNLYGHDDLNINIPSGGLRIYVVLEKLNGCITEEKNVHVKIINDGLSFAPAMDSSFTLARVNQVVSNSITKPAGTCVITYQTKQTGNSNDISTWQYSYDTTHWFDAFELPNEDDQITIKNNHTLTVNSNHTFKNMIVETNGIINVQSNINLHLIDNYVNNGDGSNIVFENSSSLTQTNTSPANSGAITYKRSITLSNTNDYVYYSSPIASTTLSAIPTANNWLSYSQNTNNWVQASETTPMEIGKGYIVRFSTSGTKTATFVGTPNNGTYTLNNLIKYVGGGNSGTLTSMLIGNPYPSALDLEAFYETNNTIISPTFYFWTHNSQYNGGTTYNFGDYATYNAVLGAGTGTGASGSTSGSITGSQYVASGQSVFVDMAATATDTGNILTFNNAHRVSGNNSQFYRLNNFSSITSDKIWLNLQNSAGLFKQVLIAYAQTATNGYDYIDAFSYDGQAAIDFYTIADSKNMVIQARSYPFVTTDIVPIGYRTSQAGNYQLSIDHLDASWENQSIFLKDNLLNITHNIKENPYSFTTNSGVFNTRFELMYQTNALHTNSFTNLENSVIVFANNTLQIHSSIENIKNIWVYDTLGRSIETQKELQTKEVELSKIDRKNQPLIIKIELENGLVMSKKVIY